jgi:hypothetical protein
MTKKGEHLDKSPLTTNPPYESGHDVVATRWDEMRIAAVPERPAPMVSPLQVIAARVWRDADEAAGDLTKPERI